MIYPIFVFKTDSETFDGYFPDVEGCIFAGDSLEDALIDAESAFTAHMSVHTENGGFVPGSKPISAYFRDERLVEDNGMLMAIDIDPTKYETKAQKFNLTMPGNLLAAMDRYIEKHGGKNRSAFLGDLVRRKITEAD